MAEIWSRYNNIQQRFHLNVIYNHITKVMVSAYDFYILTNAPINNTAEGFRRFGLTSDFRFNITGLA